jgi:hypothetical protein
VSSLRGHISQGERGHKSQGDFMCAVLFHFFVDGSYCMDPYSPYSKKKGMIFEAPFGTKINADFLVFLVVVGPYCAGRTAHSWAHFSRHRKEEVVQLYGF